MIHKYTLRGYTIVLDVYSGAVHILDGPAAELVDKLTPPLGDSCPAHLVEGLSQQFNPDIIQEAYGELLALWQAGLLYSPDDYTSVVENLGTSPVKAMCLNVSHDCNLRCTYCFAGKGDYSQGRMVMTAETGMRAIDFLLSQSGDREHLEVDFFGGEPLMNFDVVRQVVEYGRSKEQEYGKRFRFTITTNGLLLDEEKIAYINREMSNVVLSLDGRKEVNDKVRARVDGSGCYESVVPKFQKLVAGRGDKEYYVRGTFTRYNLDFAKDVQALYEMGFDQVSVEPVVSAEHMPYSLTQDHLPEIFAEYDKLADMLLEQRKQGDFCNFFHFMLDLDQGPCAIKRLRGCGCGNEYVAITPDGDIYPCHQFIGHESWKMGSLWDDSFNLEMKESFSKSTVYDKQDCRECWAKFYCSGGCNANNMQYMGSVLKPHPLSCQLEKKRLECAIAMKAAQLEMEAETV